MREKNSHARFSFFQATLQGFHRTKQVQTENVEMTRQRLSHRRHYFFLSLSLFRSYLFYYVETLQGVNMISRVLLLNGKTSSQSNVLFFFEGKQT